MAESKHVTAFTSAHLKAGELIVAWGEGYIGEIMGSGMERQYNGVLIVTGDRVAFFKKGWLGQVLETIPLKSITSIERKSLMGHYTIRLHTSHDALAFKTFQKDKEQVLVDAIEAGRSQPKQEVAPNTGSPLETLRQLAELRDAGVLSEDEFDHKKAELLAKV